MQRFLPSLAVLALAACASPSDRIADALVAYGIAPRQAQCVGSHLEQRLSINQLRELARYARAYRANDPNPGALTATDLIRVTSQVQDPRVPIEVARAAGRCGLVRTGTLGMIGALVGT